MDEKDLQNINEIDMECHITDDDDSFGSLDTDFTSDDRQVQSKTGIIIDLSDDDDIKPTKTLTANISSKNNKINAESNFSMHQDNSNISLDDFHDYNEIDMETSYGEDDDEVTSAPKHYSKNENPLFFNDEEPSGLVDEEILEESRAKKKRKTYGEVEADYWEEISKKHAKTNKKGAYNTSFHFAGNPKREQDIFNHMMGSSTKDDTDVSDLVGDNSLLATGAEAATAGGDAGFDAGAGSGEGCSESLAKPTYGSELLKLFDTIGFEIFKNSDGSYVAIDVCDMLPSVKCSNLDELVLTLKPYIDDCLIYPLQLATSQKFDSYKDWVDWYTEDNKKKFPKCSQDIADCDLLANHLHECVID